MARLQIKGMLLYADNTPAVNSNVKITDLDLIDNNHDLILSDNTDNWGAFSVYPPNGEIQKEKYSGLKRLTFSTCSSKQP